MPGPLPPFDDDEEQKGSTLYLPASLWDGVDERLERINAGRARKLTRNKLMAHIFRWWISEVDSQWKADQEREEEKRQHLRKNSK